MNTERETGRHPDELWLETRTVLSVSPWDEDHEALERALAPLDAVHGGYRWRVHGVASMESAIRTLSGSRIPILICERTPERGTTWVEMLDRLSLVDGAPCMLVSAGSADERLWAEVLNRGAFDLLIKPFDSVDVTRVVTSAWLHWRHRQASRLVLR